jgi:hypothetical protein
MLGLTINTKQCHQVESLYERWQARKGVAKLPIQILRGGGGNEWEICHYWGYGVSQITLILILLHMPGR